MSEQQTKNERKKKFNIIKYGIVEFYIWIFIAILIIFPAVLSISLHGFHIEMIIQFYNEIVVGIFVILIPLLFLLIYGKLPIEYLRTKSINRNNIQNQNTTENIQSIDEQLHEEYIITFIKESKEISEKIYARSGVYLLVGCLIAFTGIGIFYSPIFQQSSTTSTISQKLLDYLPRFSSLFFIEFIAFFFLKQYRIMLEEYRYYEAIKRKRQDNLNLTELINNHKDNIEILKLIIKTYSNPVTQKLSNGETTEVLKTQKLVSQELDLFSKVTDLIKEIKKK